MTDIDAALREKGLKVTLPRLRILALLGESSDHLSPEDIHAKLQAMGEEVGIATVYRVLGQFEAAGLVKRLNFETGRAMYELAAGEHHDHLVCVQCNTVTEFVDDVIEARQTRIATQYQFDMTDHSLVIYGLCQSCQSSS